MLWKPARACWMRGQRPRAGRDCRSGRPPPAFALPGLFGETMTLDALRARGKPLLLMFTDPNCGPCEALVPDLARWQKAYEGVATLAVVSRGKAEENRAKLGARGLNLVLLQKD